MSIENKRGRREKERKKVFYNFEKLISLLALL
jgi:hypothetical protein